MVKTTKTTVGILGAGPAGLLLARQLWRDGIASIVLEIKDREYVEHRQRAGILEQGSVDILREVGAGERMDKEGLPHDGIELMFDGERHPLHFPSLTGGKQVMIYAQTEVCKDLIALQLKEGDPLWFNTEVLAVEDAKTDHPKIRFRRKDSNEDEILECDYVVACDGSFGVGRKAIPKELVKTYERTYPFSWLGILADVPPSNDELIYARHANGFCLLSMRSPTVVRNYLQVPAGTDIKEWSDDAIWEEIEARTTTKDGWKPERGPITQKSVLPMRSFVHEPMQYGRLFLAGDAGHIVPPTGAKGLNLAFGDVVTIARALKHKITTGKDDLLNEYSDKCLRRVWQAERFSYDMTNLLHTDPDASPFINKLQKTKMQRIVTTNAAATDLALSYTGFPL